MSNGVAVSKPFSNSLCPAAVIKSMSSGGYQYVSNRDTETIEQDYKDGKIDLIKYEIRKDQIQRISLWE
jgi:hypothetical protein